MNESDAGSADERAAGIWREHRGWVAALLYAHRPRGVEVDDLLQEVAVTLVRHINTINAPEKIGPWLRTVAINVARDAARRERTRGRVIDDRHDPEQSHEDSGADGGARERGRSALAIAQSLPPEYREPLLLSLRGLSYKQISRVLELPVSTIETRLFRARNMVREELSATDRMNEAGRRKPLDSVPFDSHQPIRMDQVKP